LWKGALYCEWSRLSGEADRGYRLIAERGIKLSDKNETMIVVLKWYVIYVWLLKKLDKNS
jgi:hypothetical protein